MGFSVRVGAELDVIISASGRVLLAFQPREIQQFRIDESLERRPDHADLSLLATLDMIKLRGFESIPSVQVRGLYAVSFPIISARGNAIAAITVPYAERLDSKSKTSLSLIEELLGQTAHELSIRVGGLLKK
jgi:DNA-binding IclR family transcriptional regulator